MYARTVFDPLTIIDANGNVQPYLAQSVTPNADYTEWTITHAARRELPRRHALRRGGHRCRTSRRTKPRMLTGLGADQHADTISVTAPLVVTVTMKTAWVPFAFYLAGGIGGQVGLHRRARRC